MAFLGIDFGTRRIGLAVSESGVIATAHSTIRKEGDLDSVLDRIASIGTELGVERFVVGIPRAHGERAAAVMAKHERFAEALRQKTCKEVILWDEALTSVEAERALRDRSRGRRPEKEKIDMEAARLILQSYLDEQQGGLP